MHLHLGIAVLARAEGAWAGRSFLPPAAVYAMEGLLLALVVVSGVDYTRRYMPYLRRAAAPKKG